MCSSTKVTIKPSRYGLPKGGRAVPGRSSQGPVPLHSDLFLVAEPSRVVIREDPARPGLVGGEVVQHNVDLLSPKERGLLNPRGMR